jgi:hypothetical protein
LLLLLVTNSAYGGNGARNAPAPALTTYGDITEAGEPLKADHWLSVMESKFGLLH